jgi:glycosyltransferase involved in cell wall biosynthesis
MPRRIFGVNESDYINEWLGCLEGDVSVLLFKKGKRMTVKSYSSYNSNARRINIPISLRGKKITSVGPLDHIIYTAYMLILMPFIFLQDLVIFMTPTFFTTITIPFLKLFRKKVYIVCIDPQLVLLNTYRKKRSPLVWIYWKFSRGLEIMSVRMADAVFVVSNYLKKDYDRLNKNVFLTTNGADTEAITKIPPRRISKDFTIVYLGSLDPWRGVDILIDAFKRLEKSDTKLLIIGGGPEESRLREMAKGNKNIVFMGYQEHDIAVSYAKGADLTVIPFRNDPILSSTLSMKPFEAIACGVPIIITNTGEHADLVRSLKAGIVVEPNSIDISKAVDKIIMNKKLHSELKLNVKKASTLVDFRKTRKIYFDMCNM